jgi:hypothetical protein
MTVETEKAKFNSLQELFTKSTIWDQWGHLSETGNGLLMYRWWDSGMGGEIDITSTIYRKIPDKKIVSDIATPKGMYDPNVEFIGEDFIKSYHIKGGKRYYHKMYIKDENDEYRKYDDFISYSDITDVMLTGANIEWRKASLMLQVSDEKSLYYLGKVDRNNYEKLDMGDVFCAKMQEIRLKFHMDVENHSAHAAVFEYDKNVARLNGEMEDLSIFKSLAQKVQNYYNSNYGHLLQK